MKKLVIFASGSGSNAENISLYFKNRTDIEVSLILTNNPHAGVIERAKKLHIKYLIFNKCDFYSGGLVIKTLSELNPDLIVLAGFLWLVPSEIINTFKDKIINIHPALLPKYGGKGMYGEYVHQAVKEAGDNKTGITIHYVNIEYDKGDIIFQAECEVLPTDTTKDIAYKVHQLEYQYFPAIIEDILLQ